MILRPRVAVRAAPLPGARQIAVLSQFRSDYRPTIVFARTARGAWYRIDLPGPTNARHGWIPARVVRLRPVHTRIVVDRAARTLKLYTDGKLRYRTTVAVGRRGMETPRGEYFVRAAYRATEPALGAYAFETSAYSKLSDWPGGGIIGIHGTPEPQLLGTAASHGCVRVSNSAARALRRMVPLGTAISIVD